MQRVRVSSVFSVLVVVVTIGLGAGAAHAGPVEQLTQLTFQPGKPDVAVLRFINGGDGFFYTHDGAKSFALQCTSAIDPMLVRGGVVTVTGDGTTLMGVFDGMYEDDGTGCTWSRVDDFSGVKAADGGVKEQGKWVSDFAADPTDPVITYAVTSNGNPGSMNGIYQRDKSGKWTELGSRDEILIGRIHAVDVKGKLRFYESAARGMKMEGDAGMPVPNYMIRVSDDNGMTWTEHVFDGAGNSTFACKRSTRPTLTASWSPSIATTPMTACSSATTKARPSPSTSRSRRSAASRSGPTAASGSATTATPRCR